MKTLKEAELALLNVSDEKWLKFVEMLIGRVLELNARSLTKIEIMYTLGHYPAMYFRLTTILDARAEEKLMPEVSGFRLVLDQELDDDVYIEPLSSDGFWEDDLKKMGIDHVFVSSAVGIKKLYKFIDQELNLWDGQATGGGISYIKDEWRELKLKK